MRRAFSLLLLAPVLAGCIGGGSPTDPDAIERNGGFAITGNRGTINASIQGLPGFSGTIPTGQATLTHANAGVPAFFVVQAVDTDDGTSVLVSGPVTVETTAASLTSVAGGLVQIVVTTRSFAADTGVWMANSVFGAATVNVTSSSPAGIIGTFTGMVEATAGSGAVGTKTISGSFSATYE